MVSAKPLTIGLEQSKRLIVQSILDWFTDFLNGPGPVHMLDQTIRLLVDQWYGGRNMVDFDCVDLSLMGVFLVAIGANGDSNLLQRLTTNILILYHINMTSDNDGAELSEAPSRLTTGRYL